jgi:N-acetylglutamate synthase-like GNAT family acetyltransferase
MGIKVAGYGIINKTTLNIKGVIMEVISVRNQPETVDSAISYIQSKWASEQSREVYQDCISHSLSTPSALPRWYILMDKDLIIGCAGLITNDFISRMDLYPWICALYVEKSYRGKNLGRLLIEAAIADAKEGGYDNCYLCTAHIGYYEKFGFSRIGIGYHPWGETSSIYQISTQRTI